MGTPERKALASWRNPGTRLLAGGFVSLNRLWEAKKRFEQIRAAENSQHLALTCDREEPIGEGNEFFSCRNNVERKVERFRISGHIALDCATPLAVIGRVECRLE